MSYLTVVLSNAAVVIDDTTASQILSSNSNNTSYVSTLANMLGGLIVVIALIFLLAYIVKKLNLVPSQNAIIKTIAMTQVGQKEKLIVVEINQQQYLLGVTPHQINLLDKLAKPIEESNHSFAKNLQQAKENHHE
ncbi:MULTISPECIES: flagellar biosynthetic protein FliO [Pseudomonadati]|uniref:Flagellar protein n=1 Tax=Shewanella aestuarii TaxID=1028752 RepID=A0ABT0L216_9GAMM|nr:flagellar biosynthetic protein FliO [Shewanella aestuarii]MCL1117777.1 flagellar biosynthetic protein FliO [Shewanella aestuarii]GGN76946.1 flagellar protein [Shewanella aestuarii]